MNLYGYRVHYFTDTDNDEHTELGFVVAPNYKEAVAQLTAYYGDEEMLDLMVEFVNDHTVVELPSDFGHKEYLSIRDANM